MKKYILSSMIGCLLISSFAPLGAQNRASSWRQKASRAWAKIPSPSLPSWAKGPGFEAAKKWYRDGYSTKNLSKVEKKAFNRLKKKIAIGSIISALLITFGVRTGVRQYQQAKINKTVQTAFNLTKVQRYAIDTAMAGNISEINQLIQENPELYLDVPFGATLAGNKLLADQLLSEAKEEDKADIAENIALGAGLTGNKQRAYEMIKLPYIDKQEIAVRITYGAAIVGNDALAKEMLSLPDVNKQKIAERIAYNAATVGNDALVKKILDLEGIDRNSIQEVLKTFNLWKASYDQ